MLKSLRLRLLVFLLITLSFSTGLSTLYSYHEAQHEIQELFDAQLAQEARIIYSSFLANLNLNNFQQLQKILDENAKHIPFQGKLQNDVDDNNNPFGHEYERKIAFQIWNKQKLLLLHSLSAPREALATEGLSRDGRGYHDVKLSGKQWRVFSLWDENRKLIILTGEEYEIRQELAREISLNWILITGLTLPLIILMVLLAIHFGFAPLHQIIRQIRERDPQHLRPIATDTTPSEVQPLINELNQLFNRVSKTIERERNFTDDAAHELRTPLAALKTQAQVALRSSDNNERSNALNQIIQSVDRLTHLLQQLLKLARLGAGQSSIKMAPFNLYFFTNELLSQLAPMAIDKHIEIEMLNEKDPGLIVMAEESALHTLLRNIIDNAIRYTPEQGKILIQINTDNGVPMLCISDTGPGIPVELRERVFDRFYRATGSGSEGCGLGLSIARHCADMLQARIILSQASDKSGLKVCLYFHKHQ